MKISQIIVMPDLHLPLQLPPLQSMISFESPRESLVVNINIIHNGPILWIKGWYTLTWILVDCEVLHSYDEMYKLCCLDFSAHKSIWAYASNKFRLRYSQTVFRWCADTNRPGIWLLEYTMRMSTEDKCVTNVDCFDVLSKDFAGN